VNQLNPETQAALIEAIQDEYKARAFYEAVMNKFGSVRPFSLNRREAPRSNL